MTISKTVASLLVRATVPSEAPDLEALLDNSDYKGVMAWVAANPKKVKDQIVRGNLVPSTWAYAFGSKPYPSVLTAILVKTSAEESFTDLCNIYYNKDRKLDGESIQILMDTMLANANKPLKALGLEHLSSIDDIGNGESPCNGLRKAFDANQAFFKKLFMKMPKGALDAMAANVKSGESHDDWKYVVKKLKLA